MNKTSLIPLILLLFFSSGVLCQKSSKKIKPTKVWVTLMDNNKIMGVLHKCNEEHIEVLKNSNSNPVKVKPENIKLMKLRKKGSPGKGAWIGAASGAGISLIISYSNNEEDTWFFNNNEEESVLYGAFLVPLGAGLGAGIGAIKKKTKIKGNITEYKKQLDLLQKLSLVNESNTIN